MRKHNVGFFTALLAVSVMYLLWDLSIVLAVIVCLVVCLMGETVSDLWGK